jgi:putative sugar O-methyltransferase
MFSGTAAIDYLANEVVKDEPSASSHWKLYHSEFKFDGHEFSGLQGFGGNAKRPSGLRSWIYRFLQQRFRHLATGYSQFDAIDALADELTSRQDRDYDLDVLRQVLTLSFLHSHSPRKFNLNTTCCVLGDGFASMSSLLLASKLAGRIVLVNLNKTLLVDLWYLKLWMGSERFESCVDLVVDEAGLSQALEKPIVRSDGSYQVIAVQASCHQLLQQCPIDVFVNIASMQEMDPPVVKAYFDDMRAVAVNRDLLFYCCNRQEKQMPDGTVSRFADYPWRPDDQVLVDGPCPWHQFYYSIRPPFYRPYDGPHMHRLVTLSPLESK